MNTLRNTPNTVLNMPLQSDFNDISGNGLNGVPVDRVTEAPVSNLLFFEPMTNKVSGVVTTLSLQGAAFNSLVLGGTATAKLKLPLSPLLWLNGAATWEWVMTQKTTTTAAYICCVDPTGRSGGAAPDRIGSLYTLWSSSGTASISDKHIGSNIPSPGYGNFPGTTTPNWSGNNVPVLGDWSTHHYAIVRDAALNWTCYRDGVAISPSIPSNGVSAVSGNEQTYIGGIEVNSSPGVGIIGSVRIENVARSAADIFADYQYTILGIPYPNSGVNFDPDDRRDAAILRGKVGLSMQTGFKERLPNESTTIAAFRNMTAAAQAGTIFRQRPKMFPMPDDGRST